VPPPAPPRGDRPILRRQQSEYFCLNFSYFICLKTGKIKQFGILFNPY
jgi:hypothetical protein